MRLGDHLRFTPGSQSAGAPLRARELPLETRAALGLVGVGCVAGDGRGAQRGLACVARRVRDRGKRDARGRSRRRPVGEAVGVCGVSGRQRRALDGESLTIVDSTGRHAQRQLDRARGALVIRVAGRPLRHHIGDARGREASSVPFGQRAGGALDRSAQAYALGLVDGEREPLGRERANARARQHLVGVVDLPDHLVQRVGHAAA